MSRSEKDSLKGICDEHIALRRNIRTLREVDEYERSKNLCSGCETRRVADFGRPDSDEIEGKARFYRDLRRTNPKTYEAIFKEIAGFASAESRGDVCTIDRRVWSQFKDLDNGGTYWTQQDFETLVRKLKIF